MSEERRAVLFADLDGYTALTEAHGDLDATEVATRFAEVTRGLLRPGSRLVKTLGDAVLVVATDVADALDTALDLVAAVEALDRYPSVSVGVHYGPVVERDGDVFGRTVNLAARTAAHARPRQVLCTQAVADALDDERRQRLCGLGEVAFANVPEPVVLHEAHRGALPVRPVDPVCRMQVDPARASAWVRHEGEWHFCSTDCLRAFLDHPERYLPTASRAGSRA